jgi:hypothetical protein
MQKSIFLMLAAFTLLSVAHSAQCSNASWNGLWIGKTPLTSSKVLLSAQSLGIDSGVCFYSILGEGVSTQGKMVVE